MMWMGRIETLGHYNNINQVMIVFPAPQSTHLFLALVYFSNFRTGPLPPVSHFCTNIQMLTSSVSYSLALRVCHLPAETASAN